LQGPSSCLFRHGRLPFCPRASVYLTVLRRQYQRSSPVFTGRLGGSPRLVPYAVKSSVFRALFEDREVTPAAGDGLPGFRVIIGAFFWLTPFCFWRLGGRRLVFFRQMYVHPAPRLCWTTAPCPLFLGRQRAERSLSAVVVSRALGYVSTPMSVSPSMRPPPFNPFGFPPRGCVAPRRRISV